ncbi:hypothetical protein SAMN05216167_102719 [Spirosoma endophyticum]|uniref:Uncharacterized protein n=1 Tax=Spirosoma endophyticum TaxID=662367 RepID=A0A1I1MUL0_9BACT|nr:hypothetical protein SAMN05216167_102719 [Spirosoma endophyticum]
MSADIAHFAVNRAKMTALVNRKGIYLYSILYLNF